MRGNNAFVTWNLSLPTKCQKSCNCCAAGPRESWPDSSFGSHWCSYASITQVRLAPRAGPGSHRDVALLFLWACVYWWLGTTAQTQFLKQRHSQSTACSRSLPISGHGSASKSWLHSQCMHACTLKKTYDVTVVLDDYWRKWGENLLDHLEIEGIWILEAVLKDGL